MKGNLKRRDNEMNELFVSRIVSIFDLSKLERR